MKNVTIITNPTMNSVLMSSKTKKELKLEDVYITTVRFGYRVINIFIEVDESIPTNQISISKGVVSKLKLPINNSYLIKTDNQEIEFGPYIGIYLGRHEEQIRWKYEKLNAFVSNFTEVNGIVCAFTSEDFDWRRLLINARYYDSRKKIWIRKILPFPNVIHKYGVMNRNIQRRVKAIYGNKFFNYLEMDKWKEREVLENNPITKKYLPSTLICKSVEDIRYFVEEFKDVYMKPIEGRQGNGIYRITKINNDSFELKFHSQRKNEVKVFKNIDHLLNELSTIEITDYVLQEALKITFKNRVIDFRIRFEKDGLGNWTLSLFGARLSQPGGIVSNKSAGGTVLPPDQALEEYFGYDENEIERIKQYLVHSALEIVNVVEKANVHYAKCAVDLALDEKGRVWHIESNVKAPDDTTTMSFEGFEGLNRLSHLNMLYSKRIAGFNDDLHTKTVFNDEDKVRNKKENYKLYICGRTLDKIQNQIEQTFNKQNVDIKNVLKRKRYILLELELSEIKLQELILSIRNLDNEQNIKTFIYQKD